MTIRLNMKYLVFFCLFLRLIIGENYYKWNPKNFSDFSSGKVNSCKVVLVWNQTNIDMINI